MTLLIRTFIIRTFLVAPLKVPQGNFTSKDAPDLHFLSSERDVVSPGQVLRHRLVLVLETARRSGLDDLHVDAVAEFVLVSEVGGGRAGVQEVLGGVLAGHVGEPEVAFRVDRQPGRVDRLEPVLALKHPVDGGVGPAVGRVALDAVGHPLLHADGLGRLVLEVVELGLSDEDGVGGGRAPLVGGEALVLTCVEGREGMRNDH